ncbi:transcriptional regulator with PAS, ATPase and Fis domain [Cytobacillus horneckiae]|uniref:sigma-54-dependent transcriptional regulator n=1 Tax=Cytobacillus horneckiae TaxID=549687 RepID=UPI0019D2C022|nr:sigma-54-dependent transcriptional regulator [Cytobacillus horneckiae]MBN6888321.1 PrpR N-terminal domain-containing protein [Cytobacillus horneckiae]
MKIKIHFIAPYESMLFIIKECIPLYPELEISYSVGDLAKGAEIAALEEKKGADIIISRGGTAKLIKKNVSIPVIDMHLSGYDMIRSLTLASHFADKTAIVGFPSITSGAQAIIDLLDLPLKVFTINSSDEVAPLLLKLKNLNFRQIAGDVITLETANAFGLKGFLIQSGKETIIKSIEDAKLIYGYLHHHHKINHILEQFTLNSNRNILILDENNDIIYEYLTDFNENLISEEQLSLLNAELDLRKDTVVKNFVLDDCIIAMTGFYHAMDDTHYKIYILKKSELSLMEQPGVTVHTNPMNMPLAASSPAIRLVLNQMMSFYRKNDPILIIGEKGTGKNFLSSYIHYESADERLLLTIDFKQFKLDDIHFDVLSNVGTIKMKNIDNIQDDEKGIQLIKECLNRKIHLFVITEDPSASSIYEKIHMNKISMPTLAERQEDIQPLVQYFLADYHETMGTTAVKISQDALIRLQEDTRSANIDDLKNIIKQTALIEKDYVIQANTIEKILSHTQSEASQISLNGTLKEIEKNIIKLVLSEENNNQSRAAERLGINRATLWRKLKE